MNSFPFQILFQVPFTYLPHKPTFIKFEDDNAFKNVHLEKEMKSKILADDNVSSRRDVLSASEVKKLLDYSACQITTNPTLPTQQPFYGDDNSK